MASPAATRPLNRLERWEETASGLIAGVIVRSRLFTKAQGVPPLDDHSTRRSGATMTDHAPHHSAATPGRVAESHYGRLLAMALLSFAAMYLLMYSMADTIENVYPNSNQFYMAGLMTAAMVVIELLVMRGMYGNRKANATILAASGLALVAFFAFIRQQTAISDRQLLRSMIPHHASAILMCEQADLHDPEITTLCSSIVSGQRLEIDQMKAKLRESSW
jgi:hypothetical protein